MHDTAGSERQWGLGWRGCQQYEESWCFNSCVSSMAINNETVSLRSAESWHFLCLGQMID